MRFITKTSVIAACMLATSTVITRAEDKPVSAETKTTEASWAKLLDDPSLDKMVEQKELDHRLRRVVLRAGARKAKANDRYPYRVTSSLYEYKKGSRNAKRLTGTLRLYVLDADKKLIIKKSFSLAKMCPS